MAMTVPVTNTAGTKLDQLAAAYQAARAEDEKAQGTHETRQKIYDIGVQIDAEIAANGKSYAGVSPETANVISIWNNSGKHDIVSQEEASTWTQVRDLAETAAVLVGNYYLPGSSLLTSHLTSEGSQDQLNSDLGRIAQLATGAAGAANGNLANYGKAASAMGFDVAPMAGNAPVTGFIAPGGTSVAGAANVGSASGMGGLGGTGITGSDLLKGGLGFVEGLSKGAVDQAAVDARNREIALNEQMWGDKRKSANAVPKLKFNYQPGLIATGKV